MSDDLRAAAQAFMAHVQAMGCDHDRAAGSHTRLPLHDVHPVIRVQMDARPLDESYGVLAGLRHAPDLDVERLEAAIRGAWRNLTADDFWMDDAGQPYPDSMAVLIAREYAALRDKP